MTTGTVPPSPPIPPNPYVTPDAALYDTDPSGSVLEISLTVAEQKVNIGGGVVANAETINGSIPGPTMFLNVDDTVIVRLINDLPYESGIHWHGIEMHNPSDGTPVTQNGVRVGPFTPPSPLSPTGGTYLYKFKVPRPGLYWYHPHHAHSTNRVFRGTYGLIVVADPNEAPLIASGVLPGPADTVQLVLSDTTVCKAAGSNDPDTYPDPALLPAADQPEWLSGESGQTGPTPVDLCEIAPAGEAMQEDGNPAAADYGPGDIPNIQRNTAGRTVEGQTVLTNGVNVGGRAGTPTAPNASLQGGAFAKPVLAGQGLRLQIVNSATIRYFRLRLTTGDGTQVPLVRIGGEGGLLDNAVVEGGVIGGFDTKYDSGEILLPPASRADVVAAIPAGVPIGSFLTLWTRDYQRVGPSNPGSWAQLPTVPVMHLSVTGTSPAVYTIANGTALRASIPGAAVETIGAATGTLLDPATFPTPKTGMPNQTIVFNPGNIDGTPGSFAGFSPYTSAPHIASSRYAEPGDILELVVSNTTSAHHPFHLHGFSFQPISLTPGPGAPPGAASFTWPYREFRDNVDVPSQYMLTFRVRLEDRELADGVLLGGALGRWLFHCHIFFHAHLGMISELVTTASNGEERPFIDVGGSWAYTPIGGTATRAGTFTHHDGLNMTLTASKGTVVPAGPSGGGNWSWSYTSAPSDSPSTEYVYITAQDTAGRRSQTVFRLKVGAPDDGSDNGDPHIHTVDGKRYDFQAVGEFVLLRDREGMEIQARQTPVATQHPITDSYSGLTACVSINTAVAARVGKHRIAFQPDEERRRLRLYIDGEPAQLSQDGFDLDGNFVSAFDANGALGLRIDFTNHTVFTATPHFWTSHNVWYMNVSISHTQADEGIMGPIPKDSWLPVLASGAKVGPVPKNLADRFVQLYETFAESWRVTDESSLFVYAPGTSTETFTDRDWPSITPPCKLKPQFELPGVPIPEGIPVTEAQKICQGVTDGDLFLDCVFDVATTGDETFAEGYLQAQDLRRHGTAVDIAVGEPCSRSDEKPGIWATVLPLSSGRCIQVRTGYVIFKVDGYDYSGRLKLDQNGRACISTARLEPGNHRIQAVYSGSDEERYHPSSSPILQFAIERSRFWKAKEA